MNMEVQKAPDTSAAAVKADSTQPVKSATTSKPNPLTVVKKSPPTQEQGKSGKQVKKENYQKANGIPVTFSAVETDNGYRYTPLATPQSRYAIFETELRLQTLPAFKVFRSTFGMASQTMFHLSVTLPAVMDSHPNIVESMRRLVEKKFGDLEQAMDDEIERLTVVMKTDGAPLAKGYGNEDVITAVVFTPLTVRFLALISRMDTICKLADALWFSGRMCAAEKQTLNYTWRNMLIKFHRESMGYFMRARKACQKLSPTEAVDFEFEIKEQRVQLEQVRTQKKKAKRKAAAAEEGKGKPKSKKRSRPKPTASKNPAKDKPSQNPANPGVQDEVSENPDASATVASKPIIEGVPAIASPARSPESAEAAATA